MQGDNRDDLSRGDLINGLEAGLMAGRIDRRTFVKAMLTLGVASSSVAAMAAHATAVQTKHSSLAAALADEFDYVVCGAGSSGCVVAARLTENPDVRVLLLEAGGSDDAASILDPGIWYTNLGTERDWQHRSTPQAHLNGRVIGLSMGRVLGGGSSINVMAYVRGHKNDYEFWAQEARDEAWNYQHVLSIYKRIENWQGAPDPAYRGQGGNVWVQPARNPNPIAPAMQKAAAGVGIPSFEDHNGRMMEGDGGCAIANMTIKDGRRRSMAAQYLHPVMDRPNLTVLTHAEVRRVVIEGDRAAAVSFVWRGKSRQIRASRDIVLAMGAINTPKVLMLSGVGNPAVLSEAGLHALHRLDGVGENFQDHILLGGCIWEYRDNAAQAPRNNLAECTFFWKTRAELAGPDIQPFQIEIPFASEATSAQYAIPRHAWSIAPGLVRPKSRGRVRLNSANPSDPMRIDANFLSEPDDLRALVRATELCRDIGNAPEMREFAKREVMPGPLSGKAMEDFVRNAAQTYWHQTGTCRMGHDDMAVVDNHLRVRGLRGLRVADGSIMPIVTTGNTMAPCMIIGERMAEILRSGA